MTIGNAMLDDVHIDAGTQLPVNGFSTCAVTNLLGCEILAFWLLPVKQSRCYPNLVGDLDRRFVC